MLKFDNLKVADTQALDLSEWEQIDGCGLGDGGRCLSLHNANHALEQAYLNIQLRIDDSQ